MNMGDEAADAKVALVVGGGSGIDAGAARRLAADGFRAAILSSSGRGEALAAELGGFGVTGSNLAEADLRRFVDRVAERWERIDAVVVSSAGHGPKSPLLAITDEDWHRGMEFYLLNVVRIARLATPIMEAAGRGGSFVNVSTYAAFEPEADFPTSGVFRVGLASFAKLFADRYARSAIRMNNVLPGFISSLPKTSERRERIPMGRYGTVEEAADLIGFLAGEKSSTITGQNIRVDGGITRSV